MDSNNNKEKMKTILDKLGPEGLALLNQFKKTVLTSPSYNPERGLAKVKREKEIYERLRILRSNSKDVQEYLALQFEEHQLFSTSWEVRKWVNTGSETFTATDEWRNIEDETNENCKCHLPGEGFQ